VQQVTLRNVSRVFGRLYALHRVSTNFHAGQITGIAGGNGSGKTTLLKLVSTLDAPTNGEITYDDLNRAAFADHYRQRVGWLPHSPLLYDNLTGRENLYFFAQMYDLSGEQRESQIDRLLATTGMTDAADRRVEGYSRGMRQRLTIARALLPDPDLLLLDEPLTGLDRRGRRDIIELLERRRDAGDIIVLASHDLTALDRLADHLLILEGGQSALDTVVDQKSPSDLYGEHA